MEKTVLVVDDNPISLKITASLIGSGGLQIETASTAEQALELVAGRPPCLVVTSLLLPAMDGLGLARAIKANPAWREIPVILLTASYSPEEEAEAVKAGCECLLAKPVDVRLFPGMVALYLGAPAVPAEAAPRPTDHLPMHELREEFLATARRDCAALLAALPPAGSTTDQVDYAAIRKALHRWAGVGGTLGFPQVTATARELESLAAAAQPGSVEDLGLGLGELLDLVGKATADVAPEPGPVATAHPSKAPVILIADDDALVRAAIKRTIEMAGYRCRLADNGALTFAMARQEPPDAIVLDIAMPGMDGFQVLYSLRNVWATRYVPVLLLTASHDQQDVVRGGLLGASDYMTKPFDLDALVTRIDRLLASATKV